MRVVLTAIGSYGDVHPLVGLGKALSSRGHDVHIVTNPYYQSLVATAGLKLVPLGEEEEFELLKETPELWHPLHGPRLVMREAMARFVRPIYDMVSQLYVPGDTVVGAHGLDMGSRIAHEKLGLPLASIHLAPMSIRSSMAPPKIPVLPRSAPRAVWKTFYWLTDRVILDPLIRPAINGLRGELGLGEPVRRLLNEYWYSPQLVICMWPDWFGPVQDDWPPHCHPVGFPLWDASDQTELSADVREFLAAGPPPIVFTPGSANAFAKSFFAAAADACARLACRGILLTKYADQLPPSLPDGVRHFPFVPLRRLLAESSAFVHHGGVGSSSQGLEAGIPQVVMPLAYDQHDNAARLASLGVAQSLPPRKFRGPTLAAVLKGLLADEGRRERCREMAARCDGPAAMARACDLLENLLEKRPVATAAP